MSCDTCSEPSFWRKAWNFIRAICSKKDAKLGAERINICRTREMKKQPCRSYVDKGNKSYCNSCGCAQSGPLTYFTNLEYKTKLTKSTCPNNFWE